MNSIEIFKNKQFGEIRTITIDGEPWFVGKDIAQCLGYKNTRDALIKHVDEDDKNTVAIHDGNRGNPNQIIINESGLYSLILRSDLSEAKKFKRWVTSEVLPTIRKQGYYDLFDKEKAKELGKQERTFMTDCIRDSNENERMHGFAYFQYTNLVYKIIFNKSAKKLREERGIKSNQNLREFFTPDELKSIRAVESLIGGLIFAGKTYAEIKTEMQNFNIPKLN